MKPDPTREKTYYADVLSGIDKVQQRLAKEAGIDVGAQSRLDEMRDACAKIRDAHGVHGNGQFDAALRDDYLQLVGAAELVRLFEQVARTRELRKLDAHLKLLIDCGFGPPAALINNDASRKVFELLFGLACLAAFDDIELEDPHTADAKNPNPDIKAVYKGSKFGIACKSISTRHEQGLIDNVTKAVSQIDASDVDIGVVLIEVSRLIDPEVAWRPDSDSFWDPRSAAKTGGFLLSTAESFFKGVENKLGTLFKQSKALPCVVFYGHAAGLTSMTDGIAPTCFKALHSLDLGDTSKQRGFLTVLNKALHCQL